MAKAVLELEMPESCREGCPFYKVCDICDILSSWNHHMPVYTPSKGRRKDCPLKLVERYEWILIDDDKGLWQCSKCGAEWILEAGTPADNEMNYCPMCGRRLEVEL